MLVWFPMGIEKRSFMFYKILWKIFKKSFEGVLWSVALWAISLTLSCFTTIHCRKWMGMSIKAHRDANEPSGGMQLGPDSFDHSALLIAYICIALWILLWKKNCDWLWNKLCCTDWLWPPGLPASNPGKEWQTQPFRILLLRVWLGISETNQAYWPQPK